MKQRVKKRSSYLMIVLAALSVFFLGVQTVLAAHYEPEKKGSLTLVLKPETEQEAGVALELELHLYKVGKISYQGAVSFEPEAAFAETGVNFAALDTAEDTQAAAEKLAVTASESSVEPVILKTNAQGKAIATDLEQGMYLILQGDHESNIEVSPMLLSIPYMESAEKWDYDVEAFPKTIIHEIPRTLEVIKRAYEVDLDFNVNELVFENRSFQVGLYLDSEGTIPVNKNSVQSIQLLNSSTGSVKYEDLPEGTYYLFELDEDGNKILVGQISEDKDDNMMSCMIADTTGRQTNVAVIGDKENTEITLIVENYYYYKFPNGYFNEGELKITKKVLANGKETTVDDIFYAGIFKTDAEGNRELLKVIVLEQNKTVVTNVPLDLVKGIVVKTEYEVLETDKNGKPIGEEFPYNVSGEGLVVVESPDIAGEITIVNECIEQETESESTTETQKESETNTSVVETGDDTPIEGYMILLAVSLLVVIVMLGVKKEKR